MVFLDIEFEPIIIKSDQENAIVDVLKEIRRLRKSNTELEHSPVEEHESNGVAERAVQQHEGMCRTGKLALETRLNCEVRCTHPIITWLVQDSVNSMNKFVMILMEERLMKGSKENDIKETFVSLGVKCMGTSLATRWGGVWRLDGK